MTTPSFVPDSDAAAAAQLAAFVQHCELATGQHFADYPAFHAWSVQQYRTFWRLVLDWTGIAYDGDPEPACAGDEVETAEFFPHIRLNYTENVLRQVPGAEHEPALIAHHADSAVTRTDRCELRAQVIAVAAALQRRGLRAGDRVVAVSTNTEHLVVGALAVVAVGATLSTAAPDMGVPSVLTRFAPLEATMLLVGGADPDYVKLLRAGLPTVHTTVTLDEQPGALTLSSLAAEDAAGWTWPRLPFNHPLAILFSSGTTGPPKRIVHSAGGVLLEHTKEHVLHGDLRAGSTLFFHTSPAWMMWNWQLSALVTGAAIVVYDGRVTAPEVLWSIVAAERVTAFGTGPSYLRMCATAGFSPRHAVDLGALRMVLSTGAVLRDEQFGWVGREVGDVPVYSISGGTDIVGCFVLGAPGLPVYAGESPALGLGLDVRALDPDPLTGVGELVCATPFPSRPLGLHGDADGSRFHTAYFAAHPGVWTHGDRIEITARGSARMHGRSDGVLNVGGMRIGPAEIYAVINDMDGVADSIVVEQQVPDAVETSRLVLLVTMDTPGSLDTAAETTMRQQLTRRATPAHVPRLVVEVDDLPRTFSGKVSETAVRDALKGVPVRNVDAIENPQCLQAIVAAIERADEQRRLASLAAVGDVTGAHDVVATLCAIFADILGLPTVAPDDSFFELGGTSLGLATARHRIFERLGHDVAMSQIFTAPSPRALARSLMLARGADSLVPLRTSTSGRPVFMIHDLTGDVLAYTHLADAMPGSRPVFGVRARALDARLRPDVTVEEMTRSALERVRQEQPAGPYTLVGFSFGGMVAWQMASQLRADGEVVDLVVLVDCYVDPGCLPTPARLWFRAVVRPMIVAHRFVTAPAATMRRVFDALRGVPAPAVRAVAGAELTPLAQQVERVAAAEIRRFRPARYDGDVVFVRAEQRDPLQCEPVAVWQQATHGDFGVLRVQGGHNDTLDVAHVGPFARRLGEILARRDLSTVVH